MISVADPAGVLSKDLREQFERRMRFALSRFGPRIRRASAEFANVERGHQALDKRCRITVELKGAGQIVISDQDAVSAKCIAHAAERAGREVARAIVRSSHTRSPSSPSIEPED